ncbi:hypothetical protein ACTFIR_005189 [Dictyostelium discoideum]
MDNKNRSNSGNNGNINKPSPRLESQSDGSNQNISKIKLNDIEYIDDQSSSSTIDRENDEIIISPSIDSLDNININENNNNNNINNNINNINNINNNINNINFNNKSEIMISSPNENNDNDSDNNNNNNNNSKYSSDSSNNNNNNNNEFDEKTKKGFEDEDDYEDEEEPQNKKVEMSEFSVEKSKMEAAKIAKKEMDARRKKLPFFTHALEILIDYGQTLVIALIGTILCILAATAYAHPDWIHRNSGTVDYFSSESYAILVSTFFSSGLAVFTLVQFLAVYGMKRMIETHFYGWVIGAIALFMIVPWAFELGGHAWWFWLGDVILLIVGYTSLCFVMGYVGKPYQTPKERRWNGIKFLGTEVWVSATALIYGMFLIQLYGNFSNYGRMAWRLLVHPVYFEFLMMVPVRMLVTNQMEVHGVSIMSSLAITHALSHVATLGKIMLSTINQTELTIISVLLLNLGKLVFRSTVQLRDDAINNLGFRLFGIKVTHKESKGFVRAVNIYTEMIMENASIPASAYTLWAFYKFRGIFFLPYPDGGEFTLGEATVNVVIQLSFGLVFDALTLFINERYFNYPLERAWKKMKENWLSFFGFLLYGLVTMGMIGILYMVTRVPRFVTCSSYDVCSCKFVNDCNAFINDNLS